MPDTPEINEKLFHYGPKRPEQPETHEDFRTPAYLKGTARKILRDLIQVARIYDGRLIRLYQWGRSTDERCPVCVDKVTGAVLHTNCKTCLGSGFAQKFTYAGEYWSRVDFTPKLNVSSELGNYDRMGHRDSFYVLGAPIIRDQDLIVTVDTREVYKTVDLEGHIVAMQRIIISQVINALLVSPGSAEYRLIDW